MEVTETRSNEAVQRLPLKEGVLFEGEGLALSMI